MQATTGCKINVSQASGADIEREIGLVGTRQAIEEAKKAIWEKVDSVVGSLQCYQQTSTNNKQKEKNGGGYNNRRGGGRDQGNNYNDSYSQQPQASYDQGQAQGQANPPGAADPYAAYGGYQQYLAMWYQAYGQQQQQAGGSPPGAAQ